MGKLFICATPIGNLEDASIRLLKTLRKVDIIVCEDTRHTLKLLNHYKIKKTLFSYHKFSKPEKEDNIIEMIKEGKDIALVSDAGMPAISDPGERLVAKAIDAGIQLEVIPGPSALISALALSGLNTASFVFEGFLPSRRAKRRQQLEKLREEHRTIILYEAPHRLLACLEDIKAIMGEGRRIVLAREITKIHEEIKRGSVEEIYTHFSLNPPRGEISLIIAGKKTVIEKKSIDEVVQEVKELVKQGMDKKEALKKKASENGIKKSILYESFIKNN
ncbi:MAG: 16S rRNA (cytidine(1402)-2'-O)-methyltransferase [Syntrophomonadaceae bacterium]